MYRDSLRLHPHCDNSWTVAIRTIIGRYSTIVCSIRKGYGGHDEACYPSKGKIRIQTIFPFDTVSSFFGVSFLFLYFCFCFVQGDADNVRNNKNKIVLLYLFLNTSYNPLKERSLSCPPEDWRIPPVIDRYNSVLRSLCDRYNLTLLDTDAFIGPMWDHSPDWNHLQDWVAFPEALYLLGQLLR